MTMVAFESDWLSDDDLAAMRASDRATAQSAVVDLYWPALPMAQAEALLDGALEYWGCGPLMAAHRLADPGLVQSITQAYKTRSERSTGILVVKTEDGWQYAYAATRRNFSKLLIAGGLYIRWANEEAE